MRAAEDGHRLQQLIEGNTNPITLGEELFVDSYHRALTGELQSGILESYLNILDHLTIDEVWYLVLGYTRGQHDLEENDQELFITINRNNKIIH